MTDFDTAVAPLRALFDKQTADNVALLADNQAKAVLLVEREQAIAALSARIAVLEAQQSTPTPDPTPDPVPPPPPSRRTVLGACPGKGASPASVVSKWGQGAGIRLFGPGEIATVAVPAGAGPVHVSFKPAADTADSVVRQAFGGLRDGDYVTVWHELDVKAKSAKISTAQFAKYQAIQNAFHEQIARLRTAGDIADISTVCVLGGWRFRGGTDGDRPDKYLADADVLGVDLDGANNTKSYYDWTICLPEILRVAGARYGGRWSVPEYAWQRRSDDADGTIRAATIRAQMPRILAAGPEMVLAFDYENAPGEPLTTPAEIAAFKAFF